MSDFAGTGEMHHEDVVDGSMEENSSSMVFSSVQANDTKQTRRRKIVAPLVDTSVR